MWVNNNSKAWSNSFIWVEVAQYNKKRDSVLRFKESGNSVFVDINDLDNWAKQQGNLGVYRSIFQHEKKDIDNHPYLGNLYFDLDNEADAESAKQDTITLVNHLLKSNIPQSAMTIFFTGLKGFHIEIEAYALGIGPATNLSVIYRHIAAEIKDKLDIQSLDMQVYDSRRMWRIVNSIHQKTGLYKIPLTIKELHESIEYIRELAKNPRDYIILNQTFSPLANLWYRENIYELESKEKLSAIDLLERFTREGTGNVQKIADYEIEFDPANLFNNCKAIKNLWSKAEKEKNLSHDERLFLCSILTYTPEAIEYLHYILSQCSDYSWEKSNSHINDWVSRRERGIGGRPMSCMTVNELGIGCGDCSDRMEPRKKWIQAAGRYYISEEESMPSAIRFGYSRKGNDYEQSKENIKSSKGKRS